MTAEFLIFYLVLFIIGIVMIPTVKALFGRFFFEIGYPFAKTLGVLLLSYLALIFGMVKIIPFSFVGLIVLGLIIAGFNAYLLKNQIAETKKKKKPYLTRKQVIIIVVEEILFFLALYFLAVVRSQEPSIRGLEKFMDFGFINSILRSDYFPPLDMWLSASPEQPNGFPINYYYFGHLVGAVLIKLSQVSPFIGYNLVLAAILGQGMTLAFSLTFNVVYSAFQYFNPAKQFNIWLGALYAFLGSLIINLAGNLHTIYIFTDGYPNEEPIPFWQIFRPFGDVLLELSGKTVEVSHGYWYPNATRFIPHTIHEFPSYSYVVADLHGHVFGIPVVLTILTVIFTLFLHYTQTQNHVPDTSHETTHHHDGKKDKKKKKHVHKQEIKKHDHKKEDITVQKTFLTPIIEYIRRLEKKDDFALTPYSFGITLLLGVLVGIAYTTNALDGPIYILLTGLLFFFLFNISYSLVFHGLTFFAGAIITALPFSLFFSPFASGIGVNCGANMLSGIEPFKKAFEASVGSDSIQKVWGLTIDKGVLKVGPFLFENGNCQVSELWMMGVLWGFFWINMILLCVIMLSDQQKRKSKEKKEEEKKSDQVAETDPRRKQLKIYVAHARTVIENARYTSFDGFMFILFGFGTFLILIPEFFYIKDIYPSHFRANTMFKLGYQAFIMMGLASTYTFFRATYTANSARLSAKIIFLFFFMIIMIYPFYAFPSYYPNLKTPGTFGQIDDLHGAKWMENEIPQDKEVIEYFMDNVEGQPIILEAQGDSYTDFNRISAYVGVPTVAGWWVHQWLWRGSSDVVGSRIPDITAMYESADIEETKSLLQKYQVSYVIISDMEREKYQNINEGKFDEIGQLVFTSSNDVAKVYKIDQ